MMTSIGKPDALETLGKKTHLNKAACNLQTVWSFILSKKNREIYVKYTHKLIVNITNSTEPLQILVIGYCNLKLKPQTF